MTTYLFMAIAIIAGAVGNVLIKIGTQRLPSLDLDIHFLSTAIRSPHLVIGVILMIATFPFYTEALQRMPLHIAFPILTSGTFILADIISYFLLHETLTLLNVVGMLVVVAGLILVSKK